MFTFLQNNVCSDLQGFPFILLYKMISKAGVFSWNHEVQYAQDTRQNKIKERICSHYLA